MARQVIDTIDPAGAARRGGADGSGIVVAVVATGIDGRHPHFEAHDNLVLPPGLQHYDLTLTRSERSNFDWRPRYGERLSKAAVSAILGGFDRDLHNSEALIDRNGHGTHVAAIVGGQFDPSTKGIDIDGPLDGPVFGVAPKCKLMSLKVLDDRGAGSEVEIERALHLVLAQNAVRPRSIHAVLIPLSVAHDVQNYPCGRTPVCEVIEWLVASGVVVIAPSGNRGYARLPASEGQLEIGSLMNITDPGNAEGAITVGATHRFLPLEYGASYFSGRGPTLDGRDKPDLLAPGERILSAAPAPAAPAKTASGKSGRKPKTRPRVATYTDRDGTSSATAFVAGAVAAILSARPDLLEQPGRVKDLLLSTATDLGRHKWIQGRGLLNLSRALGEEATVHSKRSATDTPAQVHPTPARSGIPEAPADRPAAPAARAKRFSVALSFSGGDRKYVEKVLARLREELAREEVFYDRYYPHETIRPNLDSYLTEIYSKQAELVVVFLSAGYSKADWCGLEWRSVRELIKTRADHAVMPIRLDDTPIPDLLSIDGYFQARGKDAKGKDFEKDPEFVGDVILDRLKLNREKGLT